MVDGLVSSPKGEAAGAPGNSHNDEPAYSTNQVAALIAAHVAAERDCRTCKNWTPHHRSDVMHCFAALRCVAGSSYQRQGVVQLWEAAPVDAGF